MTQTDPSHPESPLAQLEAELRQKRRTIIIYSAVGAVGIALICGTAFIIRDQINLMASLGDRPTHHLRIDRNWSTLPGLLSEASAAPGKVMALASGEVLTQVATGGKRNPLLKKPTQSMKTDSASNARGADTAKGINKTFVSTIRQTIERPPLPVGFQAQWQTMTLDDKLSLEGLQTGFTLDNTRSGLEYYYYSSYLYRQLARQVGNSALSAQLEQLALSTDQMASRLRQAIRLRYDGSPSSGMDHLQVRANIMFELSELNQKALRVVDLDQNGRVLYQSKPSAPYQPGESSREFDESLQTLLANPALKQYPMTASLIRRQSEVLQTLTSHLELRWETVFHCPEKSTATSCMEGSPRHMRLYVRQTAPLAKLNVAFEPPVPLSNKQSKQPGQSVQ